MASENTDRKQSGLQFWAPLVATCLAMFIVVVDSTMMNVAVPTIVRDLTTTVSAVQGAISLYSLVMAALMLTGGKLGAIYGVKRMFITGIVIYGVGTLLAAFSWNIFSLTLGWSIIEGIAAALILPLAFTLVVTNYEGRTRAVGFGILGGVQASAAAVGPILGGYLTTFLSWRWGFGGQVAIVIVIFFFVPFLRELRTADEKTTLDWRGTILSVLGMGCLVLGFLLAGRYGWWAARRPFLIGAIQINPFHLSPAPFSMILGLIFGVAFFHWQARRERREETLLIGLNIFRNGQFMTGIGTDFLRSLTVTGLLFIIPFFLQSALDFNAFQSGLAILPFSVMTFILSMGTANLGERMSPKLLIQVGMAVMVFGVLLLYGVTSLSLALGQMIIPMGVIGVGLGLIMAQLDNLTLSAVRSEDTPEASGTNNTTRELGNALGTAVIGSLLMAFFFGGVVDGLMRTTNISLSIQEQKVLVVELEDAGEVLSPSEQQGFFNQLSPEEQQSVTRITNQSMIDAQQSTLLLIAFLLVIGFLVATTLPQSKQQRRASVVA